MTGPEVGAWSAGSGHDRGRLAEDLGLLGVREGSIQLVQASLRSVTPAGSDPAVLLDALLKVLGSDGTLVVPTFTSLNSTTSRAHKAVVMGMTKEQEAAYIDSLPVFDPFQSPSEGMGALAELVRTQRDAVRSTHPHTSFAAIGRYAVELMKHHEIGSHLGWESPVGKLYDADADSLLLGLDYHQGCTMIHMAEYVVTRKMGADKSPIKSREYRARTSADGAPGEWQTFADLDVDDGDFKEIGVAFEAEQMEEGSPDLRIGIVGSAYSRLVRSRRIVEFAAGWMEAHRTRAE